MFLAQIVNFETFRSTIYFLCVGMTSQELSKIMTFWQIARGREGERVRDRGRVTEREKESGITD
jgi:hypothetical protein